MFRRRFGSFFGTFFASLHTIFHIELSFDIREQFRTADIAT